MVIVIVSFILHQYLTHSHPKTDYKVYIKHSNNLKHVVKTVQKQLKQESICLTKQMCYSLALTTSSLIADVMGNGRTFHSLEPAFAKSQSPAVTRCMVIGSLKKNISCDLTDPQSSPPSHTDMWVQFHEMH